MKSISLKQTQLDPWLMPKACNMKNSNPATFFAAPERTPPEKLQSQHVQLKANLLIVRLLDCFPEAAFILNDQRQIVLANDKLAQLLGRSPESLVGLRLGEALGCAHACDEPAGCGTTQFCRFCGGAQATVACQETRQPQVQECRIIRNSNADMPAWDIRVHATPLPVAEEFYTVFSIRDIADEKRRLVLERLFFHDLLNTAGGMYGIMEIWPELEGEKSQQMQEMAKHLAGQMLEEIESQRDLTAAENGDLTVQYKTVHAGKLLAELCALYSYHTVAANKHLASPPCQGWPCLQTDDTLLRRVLGNLTKNALEASVAGQTVTVAFHNQGGNPMFTVHNDGVIPENVQCQIFQRSFSTKEGKGRGIGSYSVKLLTERYLHGTVTFQSSSETGTTFTVRLPE